MKTAQKILTTAFPTRGAQSALARDLGVTRQAVSRWFVGLNAPSGLTLVRMAHCDDRAVRDAGLRLLDMLHPELKDITGKGSTRKN